MFKLTDQEKEEIKTGNWTTLQNYLELEQFSSSDEPTSQLDYI